MASTIITKNSSTASATPAVGDLQQGELAVNVTDKKIYTKDSSAAIVKLVGSLGNQEASAVAITGGSIAGITDLAVADGGTGSSTAAGARSNLSAAASGANSDITSLSGLTTALSVAQGGTGVTSSTGSGSVVLSNSPTLVTPALGTPSAAVLTNATGLPLSTGISGLGTGVATFLGTPSSANLLAAVTDETGTGALVFANSPTLVTPALGTPASGVATNLTGLPLTTGVTGTLPIANGGTGQTTANAAFNALAPSQATASGKYLKSDGTNTSWDALDISTADITGTLPVANGGTGVTTSTGTGSVVLSNSPTLVTPALGTPSSATLTNATGLPISTGVSGLGTGVATALGVAVGSTGAPVVNGGALGTPSSGTVTNLTGTASININGTVGATTPTTGAFTTTTVSTSETLSYGTANGVTYLNGSKVLTSGSALTFDGTSLGIDATVNIDSASTKYQNFKVSGTTYLQLGGNSNGSVIDTVTAGVPHRFYVGGTEGMRLTSTGLGIGTSSPSGKLHVYGGAANTNAYITTATSSGYDAFLNIAGGTTGAAAGIYMGYGADADEAGIYRDSSSALVFRANNAERARIDSSGNLGVGTTTPSARVHVSGTTDATQRIIVNGSGNVSSYKLNYNGSEVAFIQNYQNSEFAIGTAVSAWMGFNTNNTERARITATGDFLVGATSASSGSKFWVQGDFVAYNGIGLYSTNASGTDYQLYFIKNGTGRGSITTTTSGTQFNTTSDYRLKNTIAPMTGALAKVAQLKPCTYKWNADGSDGEGFIAHELAEVCPHAVTGEKDAVDEEGNPKYQGIDTSFLVATVVAALQELKAEFDAYKASHP